MAKLEIPSIVVHSGSPSVPGLSMDCPTRQPPQLRKQKSSSDDGDSLASGCIHHSKFESTGPVSNNNNSSNNNHNQQSPKSSEGSPGGGSNSKQSSSNQNSKSDDPDRPSGPQPQLSRSRSNGKMKMLTRSLAMREATSPPPDPAAVAVSAAAVTTVTTSSNSQSSPVTTLTNSNAKTNSQTSKSGNSNSNGTGNSNHHNNGNNSSNTNNNSKSKNGNNRNNKERNNITSKRGDHRQNSNNNNVLYMSAQQESWAGLLCRENSTDSQCQDAVKADLDGFIAQQMSTKNRPLLLKVEDELKQLAHNPRLVYFRFPQMSSFHRMLVHRAASYFGMDHNLDSSGTCVVVNRTKLTRLPDRSFLQIMRDMKGLHNRAYSSEEPRKSILKRDYASFEDSQYKSDEKQLSLDRRSKSFDERAEEYERARRRIFSRDDSAESCHRNSDSNQDSMEDVRWSECATWSSGEPEPPGRYLKPHDRNPRLLKTESYESRDSLKGNSARSAVSKSYSFGGYTGNGNNGRSGQVHGQSFSGLQRGDSNASSLSTGSRTLAKQDSGSSVSSSRLSPSSSGYKSQSQQSDATLSATPSPTATPLSLLPMSSQGSQDTLSPEPPVIWPMTALGNIPRGSVLINPATGQPICNADGSVYHYDPENPLTLHVPRPDSPAKQTTTSPTAKQSEKKSDGTVGTEGDNWTTSSQTNSSPKVSQTPQNVPPSPTSKQGSQSEVSKSISSQGKNQYDKSNETQTGKQSALNEKAHETNQHKHKEGSQEKRNNQSTHMQSDYKKHESDRQGFSTKSSSETAISNLTIPSSEANMRNVSNAATSPMLLQSPHRQLPAQAGQPIVVPAQNLPLNYPMSAAQPQQPVQMMPVMGQVPSNTAVYPVQANGVPHYHNGSYVPGYTSPEGQTYINGYPAVPYMPHVNSYPVNVDPTNGTYMSHQQQSAGPSSVCSQGAPCCAPGYPCPYGGQVMAAPSASSAPSGPHASYEQRNVEANGQAVNELTNYMMGMNVNANTNGGGGTIADQRAGGDVASSRPDGQSPQQGQGSHQTLSYYWGPQLSSHNQSYPPTVMYYYPPNNMTTPQNSAGPGSTPGSGPGSSAMNSNSNYNRGTSPSTNTRETNKNNSNSANSSTSGGNNRNSSNRNVAASYAKGAAIYQPPVYSVPTGPNMQMAQQGQDRTVMNGYPNDCVQVAGPQQQVVYTVSSMHSSTVPTQSYQPSIYSSANSAMTTPGSGPPTTLAYYTGVQGAGDSTNLSQQLMSMNPYAGPHGYIPAAGTPPLTPNAVLGAQGPYGVHPYMYSMYSQGPNGPGGPSSPAAYQNIASHQSPMMRGMMRPNMMVGGMQSSPPPRGVGSKGFPRGQSPVGRKDQNGAGDNIRFSQPYSVPMYNIAASRYMSGDMRYMAGRLPFSIPTNTYHRAIRPFQTSYLPRPHSQPSGEALGLTRPPRVRKPTSIQARSPARGPFVGRENKTFSKSPAVMTTS